MSIEIYKYEVGDRYHHICEDLSSEFEMSVGEVEPIDMYELAEEEYKAKESNDNDFYHPLDQIDYEELRADQDLVIIEEYIVRWSDKYSFVVHCPTNGIDKVEAELTEQELDFTKDADYPIAKGLYQQYCNKPSTSAVYIEIDQYDEIAHMFQTEKIKREEEYKAKEEKHMSSIEVDTKDMYWQIQEAPREFLDVIAISLKDRGLKIKNEENLSEKRRLLRNLIESSDDVETAKKIQDFHNAVKASEVAIKSAKDKLKKYQSGYLEAKEDLKTANEDKKTLITQRIEKAIDNLEEEDKQEINRYKDELEEARAYNARKKLRRKGLIAFAKGISAAKVDNLEEKYIASANTVAVQALEQTEILTETLEAHEDIDVKTLDGLEPLIAGVVKDIDRLIKKVDDGENATAQELARLTHNEQQALTAKVKEITADNFKKVKQNIEQPVPEKV